MGPGPPGDPVILVFVVCVLRLAVAFMRWALILAYAQSSVLSWPGSSSMISTSAC
jgi:hypothetical protein